MKRETKAEKEAERARCVEWLRTRYPKGYTFYTKVLHVSRSVMQRRIMVIGSTTEYLRMGHNHEALIGVPEDVSYYVAKAIGWRIGKDGGVVVSGCGMDMGFHLIDSLGWAMRGDTKESGYYSQRWL